MSSVIERGGDVARDLLDKHDPYGTALRDNAFVTRMLAEAFAHGALWGLERAQHAVAITHARYHSEVQR